MTESGIPPLLTVSRSQVGETVVVSATGEIDINSAGQLREVLEAAAPSAPTLIIDLSGVEFIGSVGLTTLLVATTAVDPRQIRVVASPQVRRPIEVTGLDDVLSLFDTLEEAIAQSPQGDR
ncbi:STAS domain-containing protein [Nocardia sp. NPDC004722]